MDKKFDSLDSYIQLAKKTISKFAPKFYNGLAAEMLSNEDAISDIATAIMSADWKFERCFRSHPIPLRTTRVRRFQAD